VGPSIIARLVRVGAEHLGENRIADAEPKVRGLPAGPTWHLIGHLQSNKARRAVTHFAWIHSVDSVELLERLDRIAAETGRRPTVLLQVNVAGEAQKSGVAESGLASLVEKAARAEHLDVAGLMTMAPLTADPEASRPVFRRLRELRDALRSSGAAGPSFAQLSMGMTDDFEVAVEEGATLVRVGRALFRGIMGIEA
jgi:pyridoxal phosphate enzyme (YggS family)